MQRDIAGAAALDSMLTGITADLIGGQTHHGASFDQLVSAIERHAAQETESLQTYEQLATESQDPVVEIVMRLVLDDEARHHELLRRIAITLRDALNWTTSEDALPQGFSDRGIRRSALAELARGLVSEERTGAQILRQLAQQGRGLGGGLDSLLLEMMAMDSDKHARLLHFVADRLSGRL